MPDEFIDGMINRAPMLGDNFHKDWRDSWDEVWTKSGDDAFGPNKVHILVTLNAKMNELSGAPVQALETKTVEIGELARKSGVKLLPGHNQPKQTAQKRQRPYQERPYQELTLISVLKDGKYRITAKEHFGFTDGIGNPVFDGQYSTAKEQFLTIGNGAVDGKGNWRALATGEFLLGYPDEAQETARRHHAARLQPQWHLHGLSQAAPERPDVPGVS